MEVKCKETAIACYQIVYEAELRKEESQDSVVPDTLPDIGTILSTSGTPLIRSKDLSEGRVGVSANVPVKVAYLPEEGEGVYTLDVNIPVSVAPEDAEIGEDCVCTVDIRLLALETRVQNPRKIAVRAELSFAICCRRRETLRFYGAPLERECGVQALEKEAGLTPVEAVTEKTFVLTEEFLLPAGKPAAAQILSQKTTLETEEIKAVGTRLVLKGCARSCVVYASPEGATAAAEFSSGFSQIVEADALPEDPYLCAQLLLSGAYYGVSGDAEGRTLTMELHVVAQVTVYGRQRAAYLADAYSNVYAFTLRCEQHTLCAIRREAALRAALRESIETPVPAAELISASAVWGGASVSGGDVTLPVYAQIFYQCADGTPHCIRRSFGVKLQTELAEGERLHIASVALPELYAAPAAGGLELRLSVELRAFVFSDELLSTVDDIVCDETAPLDLSGEPTLVLQRVGSTDDLWALAKANHSTVQAITETNALASLGPSWNRLLLIPKALS